MRKAVKKGAARRENSDANARRHSSQCTVCNHKDRQEIEQCYLNFEPVLHVANNFGVSNNAIDRHSEFFGLDVERAADTKKLLRSIAARGFSQLQKVDSKLLIESIKELNRMEGKRQDPKPNENLTDEQKAQKAQGIIGRGKERMRLVSNG